MSVLAENRRARYEYTILETIEAGLVLTGQEVKSVRASCAQLTGSFATVRRARADGPLELWLTNATIPPWQPKNAPPDYDETRPRKLLVRKKELSSLIGKIKAEGLTAVPLRLYTAGRHIKAEIALVRSRKKRDRRELLKKQEAEREMRRALKR